ncbi:MAG: hypothetical protein QW279_11580 [Candidatus Jordarchaeaceae archaeon]
MPKFIQKEITYKFTVPTPKELFEKFKEKCEQTSFPEWYEARKEWTDTVMKIFDEIGHEYGYRPRYKRGGEEGLLMDQVWEIRLENYSAMVLAMEVENDYDLDEILEDELSKLINVKAYLKVLMFYPDRHVRCENDEPIFKHIKEIVKSSEFRINASIETEKFNSTENYIIITGTYNKKECNMKICARVIDACAKSEILGKFEIPCTLI